MDALPLRFCIVPKRSTPVAAPEHSKGRNDVASGEEPQLDNVEQLLLPAWHLGQTGVMSNPTAPGWTSDPFNSEIERYWDGAAFTMTRSTAGSAPPQQLAPAATYSPALAVNNTGVSQKSRTIAALLGFFLGGLGVHRFYLGNVGMGFALLFLGWLTLYLWNLIDWIIVLAGGAKDGYGRPVTVW